MFWASETYTRAANNHRCTTCLSLLLAPWVRVNGTPNQRRGFLSSLCERLSWLPETFNRVVLGRCEQRIINPVHEFSSLHGTVLFLQVWMLFMSTCSRNTFPKRNDLTVSSLETRWTSNAYRPHKTSSCRPRNGMTVFFSLGRSDNSVQAHGIFCCNLCETSSHHSKTLVSVWECEDHKEQSLCRC